MRLLALAAPLLVLTACGPPTVAATASARAANEFACPMQSIELHDLAPGTVKVKACGQVATYTCPDTRSYDGWTRYCIREATLAPAASLPSHP